MENNMEVPQKMKKTELPYHIAILLINTNILWYLWRTYSRTVSQIPSPLQLSLCISGSKPINCRMKIFSMCSQLNMRMQSLQIQRVHCMYSKETKSLFQGNIDTPMLIAALFIAVKLLKQRKYPLTNEWIKKMQYIHTMAYYSTF